MVARLVDVKHKVVEVGRGGRRGNRGRRGGNKDFFRAGGSGLGLEDSEASEDIETEFSGLVPLDLVRGGELATESEVTSDSISTDVEDPSDEGGASGGSLLAIFVGFNFVYEGGSRGGVGREGIKDGVDFAPQVAIGPLFESQALRGRVAVESPDDVAGVDPEHPDEMVGSELEEGEEAKGLGPGHGLPTRYPSLDDRDSRGVGGGNAKEAHADLLEGPINIFGAS